MESKLYVSRIEGMALKRDDVGLVRIVVQLYNRKRQRPVKGNRMRVLSIKHSRVSDIAMQIERAIYGVS